METDEPDAGGREAPAESNVVRFPRDWLGPLDELVPFGPSARDPRAPAAETAEPATDVDGEVVDFPKPFSAPGPLRPDDFWGEDSAAIHHALEGPQPAGGERSEPAGTSSRRTLARVSALIRPQFGRLAASFQAFAVRAAGLHAVALRRTARAVATGRSAAAVRLPTRIAPMPIVALATTAVAIAGFGWAVTGFRGTSLEHAAHSRGATSSGAVAFASIPAVIDALNQLERPVARAGASPVHGRPHPPAHGPGPAVESTASGAATNVDSSSSAHPITAPAQTQVSAPAISTHVATSSGAMSGSAGARDGTSSSGTGGGRQVAAPDEGSSGGSSGSNTQPPAGPVGPGAPFGPGHLG